MDNINNNRYYNYSNNMSQEQLYQDYMNFIRNTTQIINNSMVILSNQQNTYNDMISHHNLYNTFNREPRYRYTQPRVYRPSPLNPLFSRLFMSNNSNTPRLPNINDLANNISYCLYNDISCNTNDTCPITQQEFNSNDIVLKINACNHSFNPQSLLTWLSRCGVCPLCRHSIISNPINNEPQNQENFNSTHNNNNNRENDETNEGEDNDEDDDEITDTEYNINTNSFALQLANIISNEITRESDFSGNIQIELGLSGR
jgi:hypothetical protein